MHGRANVVYKSHASSIGEEFEPGQHGQEGIYVHSKEKEERKVSSKASAKDDALHQLVLYMKEESSRRAAMEERRQTSFEAMQSIMASFLDQVRDLTTNCFVISYVILINVIIISHYNFSCILVVIHRKKTRAICTSGLRDFYIRWPSSTRMLQMAEEFQEIRGIPNVIGAIDGSHIPIIAPMENAVDYFNRKGFHSILLQLTVDSNCMVWDYDVGWAGSIHDSMNFSRSELGKRCKNGMLKEFCLVRDCTYSARPYMLVPFKGSKDGLPDDKYYWNFIQSSTCMAVERAFGMLKARFRILLKRCNMDLRNMPSLVVACLVLHNICVVHKDEFNMEWIRDAEVENQQFSHREQGRMTSSVLSELQAVRPQTEDQVVARGQNGGTNVEVGEDDNYYDKDAHHLGSKAAKRDNLARVMYKEHTRRNV
ncbi:hypothetical protein L7F22_050105 [Adiantum nelumboides]|nr:hypothetical protein [Adiantum nelumboides]